MKQFKMSARGTISCDVAQSLAHRRHSRLKKSNDLELYNRNPPTEFSAPPGKPCAKDTGAAAPQLAKTGGDWKSREVDFLDAKSRAEVQPMFSSSKDIDTRGAEKPGHTGRGTKRTQREKETREWKFGGDSQRKVGRKSCRCKKKALGSDVNSEKLRLVYRQRKHQEQRSSRVVDIYKAQSRAVRESKGRPDVFAQFEEIQAKFDIDLGKSRQGGSGRIMSPRLRVQPGRGATKKLLRLKPPRQLKLERLIGEEPDAQLSQYQSLNYSVDPLMRKEKSASQKKFKDFSQQLRRRPMRRAQALHVRNKSSATLAENKFASRARPKKIKKISLNEQKSMNSEALSNLREQSFRYLSRADPRGYFQRLARRPFRFRPGKQSLAAQGESGKNLRIKEYEPFGQSLETQINAPAPLEPQLALARQELRNKFASHHEFFDEGGFGKALEKESLKEESERESETGESPVGGRGQSCAPKEPAKKSLPRKKKSGARRAMLNYTKPKNRRARRPREKKPAREFEAGRGNASYKAKERLARRRAEREPPRGAPGHRRKGLFPVEKKASAMHTGAVRAEDRPANSMTLNAVQGESEKKVPGMRRARQYIVNDILEKKGFDLNVLSGKNGKKAEALFRAKAERRNSKSVKLSLNNIRSSVAHLEKALAKEKNRLKNICSLAKPGKRAPAAKPKRRRHLHLHLQLRPKGSVDVKSPKAPRAFEAGLGDEGALRKRGDKKKKKGGKLSTKNLFTKFNKMSYFEFKKHKKGRRAEKGARREKKRPEDAEWAPLTVSKLKKNVLHER